jgi:hypothetical protein
MITATEFVGRHKTIRGFIKMLRKIDKAISIDPEVFIKSDWPYLWSKKH